MYVEVLGEFHAAHFLPRDEGNCKNLHGHTYKYKVTISGESHKDTGMIVNFRDIKNFIKKTFDHKYLNSMPLHRGDGVTYKGFMDNPTSENIAQYILRELSKKYKNDDYVVNIRVELWESDTSKVVT